MASLTCSEGPRQLLSVPTPYGGKQATGKAGQAGTVKEDTIRAVSLMAAKFALCMGYCTLKMIVFGVCLTVKRQTH